MSGDISIVGFVKTPGRYSYKGGMTVEDAVDEAGGYGTCSSCQKYFDERGDHPTYAMPPKVRRAGEYLQLPKDRTEWMRFTLEPGDEIEFRHIEW